MKGLLTTDSELPIQILGCSKNMSGIKRPQSISLNQTLKSQISPDSIAECKLLQTFLHIHF